MVPKKAAAGQQLRGSELSKSAKRKGYQAIARGIDSAEPDIQQEWNAAKKTGNIAKADFLAKITAQGGIKGVKLIRRDKERHEEHQKMAWKNSHGVRGYKGEATAGAWMEKLKGMPGRTRPDPLTGKDSPESLEYFIKLDECVDDVQVQENELAAKAEACGVIGPRMLDFSGVQQAKKAKTAKTKVEQPTGAEKPSKGPDGVRAAAKDLDAAVGKLQKSRRAHNDLAIKLQTVSHSESIVNAMTMEMEEMEAMRKDMEKHRDTGATVRDGSGADEDPLGEGRSAEWIRLCQIWVQKATETLQKAHLTMRTANRLAGPTKIKQEEP